ncbi:hypothetical protein T265_11835 [Opisthorchis viverrini]|uniref:Uncharacterized protein n=1 Tax=Opisthorchis viverrini TaxID=6198 RepID=A0A074ZW01_OPIVI|nr:hypothetical protein T265_11835 [Opisthorchis viverrini]KER19369.1 hypothetical protein T265_11835 [Opisthorchis viverrini]
MGRVCIKFLPSLTQTESPIWCGLTGIIALEQEDCPITSFPCLAVTPPEGNTRAEILSGCPKNNRGAESTSQRNNRRQYRIILDSERKRSAVALFRCLPAMPPEGSTRARILPGRPSLDRRSRVAEVGFEPRTFRSVNSRSSHLGRLAQEEELANYLKAQKSSPSED